MEINIKITQTKQLGLTPSRLVNYEPWSGLHPNPRHVVNEITQLSCNRSILYLLPTRQIAIIL